MRSGPRLPASPMVLSFTLDSSLRGQVSTIPGKSSALEGSVGTGRSFRLTVERSCADDAPTYFCFLSIFSSRSFSAFSIDPWLYWPARPSPEITAQRCTFVKSP